MGQILLVADRKTTIDSLVEILGRREHELAVASNQRRALQLVRQTGPDVVIVDTTSIKLSGAKVCQALRRQTDAPILAIVRDTPPDGVVPLDVDDWLVKPFSTPGLMGRVGRMLDLSRALRVGPLALDLRARMVCINEGPPERLTPKQFALLRCLMRRSGQVVTRAELMQEVWQTTFLDDTRTLDVHIRWLREKIEADPSTPLHLKTIRGTGYCLTANSAGE